MPTSWSNLYILISSPFLTQQQPLADTNTACLFEVFQFMWPGSADRKYTRGRCQQSCVSYTVKLVDNVDNMASFRRSLFSRNSSYNVDVRMKVGEWDHGLRGQAGSMGVLERIGGGGGEVLGKQRRHAQYSWILVCPSVLFSVFIYNSWW